MDWRKKQVLINSFIIVSVNGITLLLYNYINPNKDIERFYHQNNRTKYYLLYLCYSIIMISFAWNIRNFLTTLIKK